ncbi:somatomedin-B and thrombospondin type-1 domain-containing protein-like [Oncorhynchus tshawytscha]|uniref:somatomedin-B and thrombospondin type-1 domain-containing protein-like n=1 Tax=Oncorhynchus tshawytscha TaxID=74940 RepID=UPI001C3C9468|nr:somatomedin-B and thrombospondin type-1 domain-containing protein-like [Oncorhynchus tshawytscha]
MMASSVAYVLLLVAAVVLGLYHILVEGGCAGKCCGGSDITCVTTDWRMDRVYRACYCDEGCLRTKDCCYDYPTECPGKDGCDQDRQRHIVQEPKNSGEPCPNLEEQAGCMDYQSHQEQVCSQNTGPGFITTMNLFGKRRRQHDITPLDPGFCMEYKMKSLTPHCRAETRPHARWMQYLREGYVVCVACRPPAMRNRSGSCQGDGQESDRNPSACPLPPSPSVRFCMEYKMESLTPHCRAETRPHARWMQYLREGYVVCVACRPPAMRNRSGSCQGDGQESDSEELLHWLAVGNSRCRGTWKKVQRTAHCSCPHVHSFLFI